MLKRSTYIVVLLCNVMFFAGTLALGLLLGANSASAAAAPACSPGIPCTNYDLYNNPGWYANRQIEYNGLKSGAEPITATLVDSDATCDGNLMNQMYSKAFLEASRQIIMSEQIIHKPDSVLEYTCFEGYIADAATIETQFSYTDRWEEDYEQDRETADGSDDMNGGRIDDQTVTDTFDVYREDFNDDDTDCNPANPQGIDGDVCANNLAEAMNYIVNASLTEYLDNNFDHTYLGEATTIEPSGTPSGCADMATVWEIAKCLDFGEDDRFRTFQDLINADPRSIPQECSLNNSFADDIERGTDATKLDNTDPDRINNTISPQCPAGVAEPGLVAGVETGLSNNMIRVANNCPSENVAGNPGEIAHAYVMIDPIDYEGYLIMGAGTNSERYIPGTGGQTSGTVTCADPLPTGIPVITYEHDAAVTGSIPEFFEVPLRRKYVHYEFICPNPGCFYRPNKQLLTETETVPPSNAAALPAIGTCISY